MLHEVSFHCLETRCEQGAEKLRKKLLRLQSITVLLGIPLAQITQFSRDPASAGFLMSVLRSKSC